MNHTNDRRAELPRPGRQSALPPWMSVLAAAVLAVPGFAQTTQSLPMPEGEAMLGNWQFALAFVDEAIDAGRCSAIAESIRGVEGKLALDVVGHAVRTRESYSELARSGGIHGAKHSELMQWIVKGPSDFFVRVEPGGAFVEDSRVVLARTLYDQGVKVFRADGAGIAPEAYSFVVDKAGDAKASDCPIHGEWSMHARAVNYCLGNGTLQSPGVYRVGKEQLDARPPLGLHFDPQTRSYLCRVETSGGGILSVVTAFDELGQVCREWRSTWFEGRPSLLSTRVFVPFTSQLANTREFRQLAYSPATQLPDFAHMASVPDDRTVARDQRGAQSYVFDPRGGLPEEPKSEQEILDDRIEQLRRDRAAGLSNKFIDNLNAMEASQGGMTPKIRELPLPVPESQTAAPVVASGDAVVDSVARTRSVRMPVLPSPGGHGFPWGLAALGAAGVGALLLLFVRKLRGATLASATSVLVLAGLASGCGGGQSFAECDLSLADLDVFPRSMVVDARERKDESRQCTFFVSNPSGAEVEILTASTSCGCVQMSIPEVRIGPFATVLCFAKYNPATVKTVDIRLLWQRGEHRSSSVLKLTPELL